MRKMRLSRKRIKGWADLAYLVCDDPEATESQIARRLYKDTECGISFYSPEGKAEILLSGYCEGVDDRVCEPRILAFPFKAEAFWAAVQAADDDGCNLWNETHGCEDCGPEDANGSRSVNPECKTCGGAGQVI